MNAAPSRIMNAQLENLSGFLNTTTMMTQKDLTFRFASSAFSRFRQASKIFAPRFARSSAVS